MEHSRLDAADVRIQTIFTDAVDAARRDERERRRWAVGAGTVRAGISLRDPVSLTSAARPRCVRASRTR